MSIYSNACIPAEGTTRSQSTDICLCQKILYCEAYLWMVDSGESVRTVFYLSILILAFNSFKVEMCFISLGTRSQILGPT